MMIHKILLLSILTTSPAIADDVEDLSAFCAALLTVSYPTNSTLPPALSEEIDWWLPLTSHAKFGLVKEELLGIIRSTDEIWPTIENGIVKCRELRIEVERKPKGEDAMITRTISLDSGKPEQVAAVNAEMETTLGHADDPLDILLAEEEANDIEQEK